MFQTTDWAHIVRHFGVRLQNSGRWITVCTHHTQLFQEIKAHNNNPRNQSSCLPPRSRGTKLITLVPNQRSRSSGHHWTPRSVSVTASKWRLRLAPRNFPGDSVVTMRTGQLAATSVAAWRQAPAAGWRRRATRARDGLGAIKWASWPSCLQCHTLRRVGHLLPVPTLLAGTLHFLL